MSKNILVISASLRNGSNSDMLADEFMRGALESGNKAEKITLRGKSINFCKGCIACQKQANALLRTIWQKFCPKCSRQMLSVLLHLCIFMIWRQLKTFLDRTNPLFPAEYNFTDIYFLLTAADY
mgnify:CR=1 FL=1